MGKRPRPKQEGVETNSSGIRQGAGEVIMSQLGEEIRRLVSEPIQLPEPLRVDVPEPVEQPEQPERVEVER